MMNTAEFDPYGSEKNSDSPNVLSTDSEIDVRPLIKMVNVNDLTNVKSVAAATLKTMKTLPERLTIGLTNVTTNVTDWVDETDAHHQINSEKPFSFDNLFDIVSTNVNLSLSNDDDNYLPESIIRVVIFYGRSNQPPIFTLTKAIQQFYKCPFAFIDVIYLHQPAEPSNRVNETIDVLNHLNAGRSYIQPCCNADQLNHALSVLLVHPLRRPKLLADVNLAFKKDLSDKENSVEKVAPSDLIQFT